MRGLLKQAADLLFDFRTDVEDLTERLEMSRRTVDRLAIEATSLQATIEHLAAENLRLTQELERLRASKP